MKNSKGIFLVFEGIDGAGKTTQANLLKKWLTQKNLDVLLTHEPGGTTIGKKIRKIVLETKQTELEKLDPKTEALLYAADRAQHVKETILPALKAGKIVISDRYVDSSIAYQSAGRKLDESEIKFLSNWVTGGLKPDLTLVLNLSTEEAKQRWLLRKETPDQIESEKNVFHEFVKEKFLSLATTENNSEHYQVIDASTSVENVAKQIQQKISPLLKNLHNVAQK